MKVLLSALVLLAASVGASDWKPADINRQSQCLFGTVVYALPGTTCNNRIPNFYGVGRQVNQNTYDSGLGNYFPEYPYPYSTEKTK